MKDDDDFTSYSCESMTYLTTQVLSAMRDIAYNPTYKNLRPKKQAHHIAN